jgi:hypothetical protein
MSTLRLKYNKVPQPNLKRTGSVTKHTFARLNFTKFCHTQPVADIAVLVIYLNSAWKNT